MCRRSGNLAEATNLVAPRRPKRRRPVQNISPTRPRISPTRPKYFADACKDFADASRNFTADVVTLPTRPVTSIVTIQYVTIETLEGVVESWFPTKCSTSTKSHLRETG